jgi:hypothetical protein
MGLFKKKDTGIKLPGNIITMMERYGRHDASWAPSDEDAFVIWTETQEPLLGIIGEDKEPFVDALADAVVPVGGFAVLGGCRTVLNLVGEMDTPSYDRLMSGTIEFLRASGVPPMQVTGYEWQYWIGKGGTNTEWIPLQPIPSTGEAPIADLSPGEVRRVAQMFPEEDSNVVFVLQRDDGLYAAMIDCPKSDEDRSRTQWEWKTASSMRELYIEIANSLQSESHWCDPQLQPFYPLPKAPPMA